MNRRIAFPFLILSESAVSAGRWEVSLDGRDWTDVGEYLPDWDSSSKLLLRRILQLDSEVAAHDLAIPRDQMKLAAGVRIGTGPGRLPRMILQRQQHVLDSDSWEQEFTLQLSGQHLSVVLDLLTEITLATPPNPAAPLSPQSVGDRLWSESVRVRLEGEEPRFPIETADLATLAGDALAASAPWHLHWSPADWDRDFHGAVRLYLNQKATKFLARVESQDGATLQVLLADVMSQVCERFVLDPGAAEIMQSPEPGSLGAQAATWLRKVWPDRDIAFIRSVLENRPGAFRSAFLALAELGET